MVNNININITTEAWADIVIKNWRRKISELDIGITNELYESFKFEIISQAGGNPERIDFAFNAYGHFTDMGVGNGVSFGNPDNVITSRKAKRWYSPVIYRQAIKLSQILSEKYAIKGATFIREHILDENEF